MVDDLSRVEGLKILSSSLSLAMVERDMEGLRRAAIKATEEDVAGLLADRVEAHRWAIAEARAKTFADLAVKARLIQSIAAESGNAVCSRAAETLAEDLAERA